MSNKAHYTFDAPEQLYGWLQANHASETELWVRIYKKGTGLAHVEAARSDGRWETA